MMVYFSWLLAIMNILLAAAIIFLERRNVGTTWAWLLILLFIPIVGFVVYVVFGQNLSRRKIFRLSSKHADEYQLLLEGQLQALETNAILFNDISAKENQSAIHLNLTHSQSLFSQDNHIDIFTDGEAKFSALLRDIEAAQHHIHLLYFILKNDNIGKKVRDALVAKAKQGVKVRVLVDDMGSVRLPRSFFHSLIAAGGQASAFFPSKWLPYLNFRMNYRNHRKLVIIDGQTGYIGGFNIGDEYLGKDPKFGYWRDTHLRLTGSAVDDLQFRFMLDWSNAATSKFGVDRSYFPLKKVVGTTGVQIVSSGPDSERQQIKDGMIKLMYSTKKSMYIQTPYFIPDESMMHAIKIAVMSGVDVRIMIPNKPDHIFVYWASLSQIGELLPLGVRIFIYEHGFIHAKTIVMDGKTSSVGTANFDVRSFKLNFEVNAFIYDIETSGRLHAIFEEDMALSTELTWEKYQQRKWTIRFKESVSRLLSPIL
jgi:cardiolipin synthase